MKSQVTSPFCLGSYVLPGISKLTEEFGEALQVMGKLIATGGNTEHYDKSIGNLKLRLRDELADSQAAIDAFMRLNFDKRGRKAFSTRYFKKYQTYLQWHWKGK